MYEDLIQRLRKYLTERKRARGLDQELIHGLNTGGDVREAGLTVADVAAAAAALEAMQTDAFVLQMLVAAGHVTQAKVAEARSIAAMTHPEGSAQR